MFAVRSFRAGLATLVVLTAAAVPALAQTCKREGTDVMCNDGRRGVWTGTAIIWQDGTRSSSVTEHPSVIIGNKQSIHIGQGVFVGSGNHGNSVPLDDPNAPNKTRCAILDGVSYCE